jgi:hypothetical protein
VKAGYSERRAGHSPFYPSKRGCDYSWSPGRSATKPAGTLALRYGSVWRPSTREEGGRGAGLWQTLARARMRLGSSGGAIGAG